MSLESDYKHRYKHLLTVAKALEDELQERLGDDPMVDRVYARAKDPARFMAKAMSPRKDGSTYADPLRDIHDQIGVRVIVKFDGERQRISDLLEDYLHPIEVTVKQPDEPDQFRYEANYLVCHLPPTCASQPA